MALSKQDLQEILQYVQANGSKRFWEYDEFIARNNSTKWTKWTPTVTASGSMTIPSLSVDYAEYKIVGDTLYFQVRCTFTTGGTASNSVNFTLPKPTKTSGNNVGGGCHVLDSNTLGGLWVTSSTTTVVVRKYDNSNWGLGTGRQIRVQGFYKIS